MSLNVIDIGRDQNGLDLNSVPHDAVIVAASDGQVANPYFHGQYAQARGRGDPRGAYHYFRGDPAGEAAFFVANAAEVPGDGQIWCDSEVNIPNLPSLSLQWLRQVEALSGVRPAGVYTMWRLIYGDWAQDWSPVINAGYEIWEAQYPISVVQGYGPVTGPPATPWPRLAMWQYSSTGRLQGWGGNLDLSVFYGDRAAWDGLVSNVTAQGGSITPLPRYTPDQQFLMDLFGAL